MEGCRDSRGTYRTLYSCPITGGADHQACSGPWRQTVVRVAPLHGPAPSPPVSCFDRGQRARAMSWASRGFRVAGQVRASLKTFDV